MLNFFAPSSAAKESPVPGTPDILSLFSHIHESKKCEGVKKGMRDYIRKRVLDVSQFIIDTNSTIRHAAKVFGVSKSTVHKDVTERLPRVDEDLANLVKKVLDQNKAERHLRGGEATKRKYRSRKRNTPAPSSLTP